MIESNKEQPQAVDIEEIVLGSILLESEIMQNQAELLIPGIFYKLSHQKVFNAINILFKEDSAIDILTVTNKLKSLGELESIGGPLFIVELTSRIGSCSNIDTHIHILYE